jgi:hypothetical protein
MKVNCLCLLVITNSLFGQSAIGITELLDKVFCSHNIKFGAIYVRKNVDYDILNFNDSSQVSCNKIIYFRSYKELVKRSMKIMSLMQLKILKREMLLPMMKVKYLLQTLLLQLLKV